MDNQQGKVSDIEIGWLSGLFDGEGCVDFQQSKSSYCKKKDRQGLDVYYYPRVRICMTHANTLLRVKKILSDLFMAHHISWRYPQKKENKSSWSLEIVGFQRVKKFLLYITPYLLTKKKDAENMIDFIQLRESHVQHDGYSEKESSLIEKMRNR